MKLLVLGSAGYHPTETRQTTCLMIPELGLVLDAGTGFFRVRDYIQTPDLHILLSHAHADHSIGLTYLIDVLFEKLPEKKVSIYSLEEHLKAIRETLFDSYLFPVALGANSVAITKNQEFEIKGVKILTKENTHRGGSLGFRCTFPSGKVLVYLTDTTSGDKDVDFMRGADLLIHECYFPDDKKERAIETGHTWTSEVNRLAKLAGVKKLLLMHVNPLDPREDPTDREHAVIKFPGSLLASDHLEIEL